jgi:16S rRNA (cytidine1402-2'-O)-methyltransferase
VQADIVAEVHNRYTTMENRMTGSLFVVSTPIGNLDDISTRARVVLESVDWVACEDTRHSGLLLSQLGISARLISYHDHNEQQRSDDLLARLQAGETGALISDAGTPLLSDPGYILVRACQQAGVQVVPVPGASALLAALAVAGLPTDRFLFQGFLPARGAARQKALTEVLQQPVTVVLYEAPHRLLSLLEEIANQAPEHELVLCRELTKRFETVLRLPAAALLEKVRTDDNQQRGEMVLLVAPADKTTTSREEMNELARLLLKELPASRVARVLAAWSGEKRQSLYQWLEALQDDAITDTDDT